MKAIYNPHEAVLHQLLELKKIILDIKNAPKEDYALKYYTRKQVGVLTSSSVQSIDTYIRNGWIIVEHFGPKKKLIHHYQVFNEDQSIKVFKYKRKA